MKTSASVGLPDVMDFIGECKKHGDGKAEILAAFHAADTSNTGDIDTDLLK